MDTATVAVVVVDGVGVGASADAGAFGTSGADTLAHTASSVGGLVLPRLERLGLGRIATIDGVAADPAPTGFAARGRMRSAACDTPSGHWELMGTVSHTAPVCFLDGFPDELLAALCAVWEVDGVLANRAMSGLAALDAYGDEHLATGRPIVYTSADSVLQVACHIDRVGVERLWEMCEQARAVCSGPWEVGRVIARPFDGAGGTWRRASEHRRDLSVPAPDGAWRRVHRAGWPVWTVGKAGDIFGHEDIDEEVHAAGLVHQLGATSSAIDEVRALGGGLVVANVVEFDYRGHARDPEGMARALRVFDGWLALELARLRDGDVVVVTADHGNDPTHVVDDDGVAHADHTREDVPVVVAVGGRGGGWASGAGGVRGRCDMADVGASVCRWLGVRGAGLDGTALELVESGGREGGVHG